MLLKNSREKKKTEKNPKLNEAKHKKSLILINANSREMILFKTLIVIANDNNLSELINSEIRIKFLN